MASALDSKDLEIREGFLCPICMKDLGTVGQLQVHFENSHSTEDKAVFHSIKDLFGKAKKKILKLDTSPDDFAARVDYTDVGAGGLYTSTGYDPAYQEHQDIGSTKSHTDYFKQIRSSRIDRYVVETNKLLIRLDKLVGDGPFDPAARKVYEKSVVYWVADSDVRLCPGCGRSFGISRRRHHCRLCGGIMCANCSAFILFSYARKLTNPVFAHQSISQPSSPMHRSGSNSSLNSLLNAAGEPHIRVCVQCKLLLDRRDQQVEERTKQPIIVQMYERLKHNMVEAERLCPIYLKMADSLNCGESNYHLRDAQELRIKLIRHSETIDMLSKRIAILNRDNPKSGSRDILLQKGIRNRASSFLQDHVIGLPSLPSEDELKALQVKRREEIQKQIALEKQKALEALQRLGVNEPYHREESPKKEIPSSSSLTASATSQRLRTLQGPVSSETGWGPEARPSFSNDSQDPMVQQMNNIRNYIKQARAAHLYDEVQILEANLRELQREYWSQKEQTEHQH